MKIMIEYVERKEEQKRVNKSRGECNKSQIIRAIVEEDKEDNERVYQYLRHFILLHNTSIVTLF